MIKGLIIPVNSEALSKALVAIVGEATAKTVVEAYKVIDEAMVAGYQYGINEADEKSKVQAQEYVDDLKRIDASDNQEAFKAGYDAGAADASQGDDAAYDDGYVDGVSDARLQPSYADGRVAELCGEDYFDHYDDELDIDYFDDTPSDGAIYAEVSRSDELDRRFA